MRGKVSWTSSTRPCLEVILTSDINSEGGLVETPMYTVLFFASMNRD